jgi:hypothetical protein
LDREYCYAVFISEAEHVVYSTVKEVQYVLYY